MSEHTTESNSHTRINKLLSAFLLYGLLTASYLYVCYAFSLKEYVQYMGMKEVLKKEQN